MGIKIALNKSSYHRGAQGRKKLQNVENIKCCFSYTFFLLRLHVMVAEGRKTHLSEFMDEMKGMNIFTAIITKKLNNTNTQKNRFSFHFTKALKTF